MSDELVKYNGQHVSRETFRAYVYGSDDKKKLANSWGEYQDLVSTGLWFDKKPECKPPAKPRKKKGAK